MTASRDPGRRAKRSEFQQAVERLEKAVHDLVGSATNEFSDRATAFLNETTSKLEREFSRDDNRPVAAARRMRARRRARRSNDRRPRSRRLYRDPAHAKIGGVCAGIANYYGMETWVIRCMAVTGLCFLGQIVFPAYWIAYFVMEKPPKGQNAKRSRDRSEPIDHSSPAPELGMRLSPRRSLRNVQADLSETELRLRRMETHVTSGQYELQKELNKIDQEVAVVPVPETPNGPA